MQQGLYAQSQKKYCKYMLQSADSLSGNVAARRPQPEENVHFVEQLADSGAASLARMTFSGIFTNLLN